MINVGRLCNNKQEEGALSMDAHMSFTKTTGLRAFEVLHFFLDRLITKTPGFDQS